MEPKQQFETLVRYFTKLGIEEEKSKIVAYNIIKREAGIPFIELFRKIEEIETVTTLCELEGIKDICGEMRYIAKSSKDYFREIFSSLNNEKEINKFFKKYHDDLVLAVNSLLHDLNRIQSRFMERLKSVMPRWRERGIDLPIGNVDSFSSLAGIIDKRRKEIEEIIKLLSRRIKGTESLKLVTEEVIDAILTELLEIRTLYLEILENNFSLYIVDQIKDIDREMVEYLAQKKGKYVSIDLNDVLNFLRSVKEEARVCKEVTSKYSVHYNRYKETEKRVASIVDENLKRIIETVDSCIVKPPLVISSQYDLYILEKDIVMMERLARLFEEIRKELEILGKPIKVDLNLRFSDPITLFEDVLNQVRLARLTEDFPQNDLISPLDDILSLYSRWRNYLLVLLESREKVREEDLTVIPPQLRSWFLKHMEREGLIKIEGGLIKIGEEAKEEKTGGEKTSNAIYKDSLSLERVGRE